MVTEYGMSDTLGAVSYRDSRRGRFLDVGLPLEQGNYAEQTAQQIDAEVRQIITQAQATARAVLTDRRQALELVTKRLLEREVIEGDELRAILDLDRPAPPTGRGGAPAG
jgi:cell division protease FtsH